MNEYKEIVAFLEGAGPWGFVAILLGLTVYLWKELRAKWAEVQEIQKDHAAKIQALQEAKDKALEEKNKLILDLVATSTANMTRFVTLVERLEPVLHKLRVFVERYEEERG